MKSSTRPLRLFARIQARVKSPLAYRLTTEQLEYINQTIHRSSYLKACPGSGKTEVVGIKAAAIISEWDRPFAGIVVLSFTRTAASEIKDRIARYAGGSSSGWPHFAGTFDSWLHQYIIHPCAAQHIGYAGKNGDKRIRIFESTARAHFLSNYATKVSLSGDYRDVRVNQYSITPEGVVEGYANTDLAGLSDADREKCLQSKLRFFAAGFATYEDCSYLAYKVLTGDAFLCTRLANRFPCIIVDECQDLCRNQLGVLYRLWEKGCAIHLVGDPNQSIFEFRKVEPACLERFVESIKPVRCELTRNHRSNQVIADVCSGIAGTSGAIIGNEITRDTNHAILWQYSADQLPLLPQHFSSFVASRSLDPKNCAIIARGKTLITRMNSMASLPEGYTALAADAIILFHRPQRSVFQLQDAIQKFGFVLSNIGFTGHGNKSLQYCPDCFEPVEWRMLINELLSNARPLYDAMLAEPHPIWKDFAKSLREYFESVWGKLSAEANEWQEAKRRIQAPDNIGEQQIDPGQPNQSTTNSIRFATIHDIKGENLDAVMLTSSPNRQGDKGGHFQSWLEPAAGNEEYTRFAYVACSRPRHFLIVATPKLKDIQLQAFLDFGFVNQEMGN